MAESKFTEASGLLGGTAATKPPRPSLLSAVGGIKTNGGEGGDNS